jgi:hypothetical protein
MTISLTPGCFESFLFYRAGAPECEACSLASACRAAVLERAPRVAKTVAQLDARFSQERSADLVPWLQKRLRRPDASAQERKRTKARETLENWKRAGINVFELRHKMNPAPATDHWLNSIFAWVIHYAPGFTRGDLVREVRDDERMVGDIPTKAVITRQVNTVCDALLEAGVLKSESRGILCLNH